MEDITRPNYSCKPISAPTSKLATHKDSHVISKFKPKVRIIHIFAPEIIKTDVANFRELVQRLTGKPDDNFEHESSSRKSKKTRNSSCCKKLRMMKKMKKSTSFSPYESNTKTVQFEDYGLSSLMQEEKLKMEEENNEIWRSNGGNSSELFEGFSDFNGFIHDLSNNVSLATPHSSHMDVFGDLQFA